MLPPITVRPAAASDAAYLLHVIALAADWRAASVIRSTEKVVATPRLAHYAPDWAAALDAGVVAEAGGEPIGAAWWRFFSMADTGYGFVADDVPEVTVGVDPAHRGRGVGERLMRALIALAQDRALRGLSLSVEPDNHARELYRRLGFVQVAVNGGADTMLLNLDAP